MGESVVERGLNKTRIIRYETSPQFSLQKLVYHRPVDHCFSTCRYVHTTIGTFLNERLRSFEAVASTGIGRSTDDTPDKTPEPECRSEHEMASHFRL